MTATAQTGEGSGGVERIVASSSSKTSTTEATTTTSKSTIVPPPSPSSPSSFDRLDRMIMMTTSNKNNGAGTTTASTALDEGGVPLDSRSDFGAAISADPAAAAAATAIDTVAATAADSVASENPTPRIGHSHKHYYDNDNGNKNVSLSSSAVNDTTAKPTGATTITTIPSPSTEQKSLPITNTTSSTSFLPITAEPTTITAEAEAVAPLASSGRDFLDSRQTLSPITVDNDSFDNSSNSHLDNNNAAETEAMTRGDGGITDEDSEAAVASCHYCKDDGGGSPVYINDNDDDGALTDESVSVDDDGDAVRSKSSTIVTSASLKKGILLRVDTDPGSLATDSNHNPDPDQYDDDRQHPPRIRHHARHACGSDISHHVKFGDIQVHYHPVEVGDSPSVTTGIPLTISWSAEDGQQIPVDEFENVREPLRKSRLKRDFQLCGDDPLVLSSLQRARLLKHNGYTKQELMDAIKIASAAKKARQQEQRENDLQEQRDIEVFRQRQRQRSFQIPGQQQPRVNPLDDGVCDGELDQSLEEQFRRHGHRDSDDGSIWGAVCQDWKNFLRQFCMPGKDAAEDQGRQPINKADSKFGKGGVAQAGGLFRNCLLLRNDDNDNDNDDNN